MEGVLTSDATLQQLALAAFIGPLASHEHRGSKVDQLVYLAIWSLARDWLENGCDDPDYAKSNTGQRKLQWGGRAPNLEGNGISSAVRRTKWSWKGGPGPLAQGLPAQQ